MFHQHAFAFHVEFLVENHQAKKNHKNICLGLKWLRPNFRSIKKSNSDNFNGIKIDSESYAIKESYAIDGFYAKDAIDAPQGLDSMKNVFSVIYANLQLELSVWFLTVTDLVQPMIMMNSSFG